ncbi:hypothetical protein SAMN05192553_11029 [Cyclobacterium xiamenense]|uniref:Sensor n=1 Tax=Cyclobacterium xiamenense TaxID=1297121 RepID=A0A1H7BIK2_9BACT|nr:hypothetical protein [Cyclobacterium xiamenense]SEJ73245.1 hypothetical protein SAMN05192553_11029 [Cyclobacterium xiamenense]
MEKSIESIWKQGFLAEDALVAPTLNNLYKQKSIHVIEKFKRMFRINQIAIVAGSVLFLAVSFLIGIPLMGIGFFLTLSSIVLVNRKFSRTLSEIDTSENSYRYVKAFAHWLKELVRVNRLMARFYYPLFFLFIVLGFWQFQVNGKRWGDAITHALIANDPGAVLLLGVPVIIIVSVLLLMLFLAYVGGRIFDWDLTVVYGAVLRKLDEIKTDMETLRNERVETDNRDT